MITAGTVCCWYFDVRELASPELFEAALRDLPWAERRERVLKYRHEKSRRLCLGAGVLAAFALRREGVCDLTLTSGENGKPLLSHGEGICFNISHSGDVAVCAVSHADVGADVEEIKRFDARVAGRCFTAAEQAWLAGQADTARAFYRLWTRKESYMKCVGAGFSIDPRSFCVLEGSGPEGYCFRETEAEGHRLCVCTRTDMEVRFARYSLAQGAGPEVHLTV